MSPDKSLEIGGDAVVSLDSPDTTDGLTSRLRDPGGASSPTSVDASDDWLTSAESVGLQNGAGTNKGDNVVTLRPVPRSA